MVDAQALIPALPVNTLAQLVMIVVVVCALADALVMLLWTVQAQAPEPVIAPVGLTP
jgi:hypothetical protein